MPVIMCGMGGMIEGRCGQSWLLRFQFLSGSLVFAVKILTDRQSGMMTDAIL